MWHFKSLKATVLPILEARSRKATRAIIDKGYSITITWAYRFIYSIIHQTCLEGSTMNLHQLTMETPMILVIYNNHFCCTSTKVVYKFLSVSNHDNAVEINDPVGDQPIFSCQVWIGIRFAAVQRHSHLFAGCSCDGRFSRSKNLWQIMKLHINWKNVKCSTLSFP